MVPPEFFATRYVESILDDDKSSYDARKIIDQHRASLDEHHAKRLEMMVDAYEGDDVRTKLEELYRSTDSSVDLRNLIEFLKRANDRGALKPLCRELYQRMPTEECAIDVVASLSEPSAFDYEEIIRFLDENDHLLGHSEQLRNAKSAALYHSGRVLGGQEYNRKIEGEETNCGEFATWIEHRHRVGRLGGDRRNAQRGVDA